MRTPASLAILFVLFFSFAPPRANAQEGARVMISPTGGVSYTVQKANFFVCLSKKGEITGYNVLVKDGISYDLHGRVERVGSVRISYDLHERIDKIDNESISYDLHDRVERIGTTRISYDLRGDLDNISG